MYSRFQFELGGVGARIAPVLGLGPGRCIGITRNSLGFIQIPVLGTMVVVVQLSENFLD